MLKTKSFLNSKYYVVFKLILFVALFFVTGRAGINGLIKPFVFGTYFALIWCNQNVFLLSISYLFANYLINFSLINLGINLIFCLIFLIIYGVHHKVKKPMKPIHILIYALICCLPNIVFSICCLNESIYFIFIELVFGLLYTYVCLKLFESVCVRGICSKFTALEIICFSVFNVSIFCGINAVNILGAYLVTFFASTALLLVGYVANQLSVLIFGASASLGTLLFNNNPTYFCIIMLYSLTVCLFKTKNKYITIVAVIMVDILCGFYLNLYTHYGVINLIPILASGLLYILFPNKILDKYSNEFIENLSCMTEQSVINRNREMLHYKLVELSDVFLEMNKVFRGLISGTVVNSDAKRLILREVKIKNCNNCPNHSKCYRVFNDDVTNSIISIINAGYEKGRVTLLDVPTLFAGNCERLNALVGSINDLISQYKNYAGLINNIDASRLLLAEQLGGVSEIMRGLAQEVNKGVIFEKGKEKKIIDELTYNNIICSDALVFQDNNEVMSVALTVRKNDALKSSVEKIVSKICCHKMEVSYDVSCSRAGWQVVTLKTAPKYDLIFGVASKTKTGSIKSGDCFSIIKIKDGKYLLAVCDGMGSGEKAEQTSSTALGLVENFYKAGFDKDIIISSVNKLMSLGKEDVFSALDLCVIDTMNGVADFIKMGAVESFIKHKDTTEIVDIGALPLGIIQNIETKNKEVYINSGDKIIIVSDGVTDGFKSVNNLQDFVNNITTQSPQSIADQIVERVLLLNNNVAMDDITVIVAKIFEK